MKNRNSAYGNRAVFAGFFLAAALALPAGGCKQILESPDSFERSGNVLVTLAGSRDALSGTANQSYLAPARTMLAVDSGLTGY